MPYPNQAPSVHVEQLGDELCIYDWQRRRSMWISIVSIRFGPRSLLRRRVFPRLILRSQDMG